MTQCPECGYDELEVKKEVVDNEVQEGGSYCPNCRTDFAENVTLHWDDIDFPLWIHEEMRLDDWDLWRTLKYSENLWEGSHNGVPNVRDMKCIVVNAYFKVEEDGSVSGPYKSKHDEEEMT